MTENQITLKENMAIIEKICLQSDIAYQKKAAARRRLKLNRDESITQL